MTPHNAANLPLWISLPMLALCIFTILLVITIAWYCWTHDV